MIHCPLHIIFAIINKRLQKKFTQFNNNSITILAIIINKIQIILMKLKGRRFFAVPSHVPSISKKIKIFFNKKQLISMATIYKDINK